MQPESIVLGKQLNKNSFISALQTCEERRKLPPGYINYDRIRFLRDNPGKTDLEKAGNFDLEAREIMRAVHEAQRALIVDADSLENGLAIINQYKGCWKVTDELVEKLYIVAYDPEDPKRVEIMQDIKEAFLLLQRFRLQNKAVFITAKGYAFNFDIDLTKSRNEIDFPLPEFEKIIEVNPEQAWSLIRSKVIAGKTVFIHEPLLKKNPTIPLITKTLTKEQRERLNVVKARKGF